MDLSALSKLKDLYKKGSNLSQILRDSEKRNTNTPEIIQISYDFQAGSYIKHAKRYPEFRKKWSQAVANEILGLRLKHKFTVMEAGVGEATTFAPVAAILKNQIAQGYGFDISWSRLAYGNKLLYEYKLKNKAALFMADLATIPLADNSIDVVYTAHSIEPNGGKEKVILAELYRVCSQYLVLLEPDYTLANKEARQRMKTHGFITRLPQAAKELGYEVIEHRLFDLCANPANPTGLLVIRKGRRKASTKFMCPISKRNLIEKKGVYFAPKGLLAYPIINEIPCLMPQNAIVATQFEKFS